MKRTDKKSPFKVPKNYFNHFDQNLAKQILSINPVNGFKTPDNYFQEIENFIVDRVNYSKLKKVHLLNYIWKAMAVACVITLFFINEKKTIDHNDLVEFFIEDYLIANTTYDIAEHSDYYFEMRNFIENYESIDVDDALEIRLYGESPSNLNLFDYE
tara:strand:- start:2990 stop:3460 length:471 start_codon:yes stop_codon:yes gene_type:complete